MNNNLNPCLSAKCYCGRYMTIGEWQMGIRPYTYKCPDCLHRMYSRVMTREQYYDQFKSKEECKTIK